MAKSNNRTKLEIKSSESDKLNELNSKQKIQQKVLEKMIGEINKKSKNN